MKIFFGLLLTIMIGGFIFFRSLDFWVKYRNKKVGKKYCDDNGLKFIKAESYELHTRIYFEKDGIKSWANYETNKGYNITWRKENPLEKIESLRQKKTGQVKR
jgi:hypothetical protein